MNDSVFEIDGEIIMFDVFELEHPLPPFSIPKSHLMKFFEWKNTVIQDVRKVARKCREMGLLAFTYDPLQKNTPFSD